MNRSMHRTLRVLAVGLLMAAVAGCSPTPDRPTRESSAPPPVTMEPAPVAESVAKYDALRAELVAALEQKMPDITWSADEAASLSLSKDGQCFLHPQTMKSSADIVKASENFKDVFAVSDPILEKHGFPAFDGTDPVPGGWVVTRSADGAGATVTIESKSPAYLRITAPVKSRNCDENELLLGDK